MPPPNLMSRVSKGVEDIISDTRMHLRNERQINYAGNAARVFYHCLHLNLYISETSEIDETDDIDISYLEFNSSIGLGEG